MRYVMRKKLFSFADNFTIKDENENDAYVVAGKVFTLAKQLSFQDLDGNELAHIKQKIMSWRKTYEIHRGDDEPTVVSKENFTLFKCRFEVDVPGPDDLEAEGNFLDHEYEFTRDGRTVARISKEWFTWADTYGVEIADGEDDVLILASTVVIDMCCHDDRGE